MAETAAEIVKRWRRHVQPEVPKEDVASVLDAYFPGVYTHEGKGSHIFIVQHEALRLAHEYGASAHFTGGTLSISVTKGRYVKAYLVKMLLDAIEIKEAFDAAQNPERNR